MTDRAASRASFVRELAEGATSGTRTLLLAPLGAGKTQTLLAAREALRARGVASVYIDLFTAASTPEHLLETLGEAVLPFLEPSGAAIRDLLADGASDRHRSSSALLRLFDVLATASVPFVWLVDEVTEIRSLAYFPELGQVEGPFTRALSASRGVILASSYLGLATTLFPAFEDRALPRLTQEDLEDLPSLRSDLDAIETAIHLTHGSAATLLPLVRDLTDTRDLVDSMVRLLSPGGALELTCRRHYEVLLLRSRGYAVAKRTAEVVAGARGQRLTDLFPGIGRTAGASRQYLRWLVEVGLLTQTKKRYDFADPMLGLWGSLYLGRGDLPNRDAIKAAVEVLLAAKSTLPKRVDTFEPAELPKKRIDRFEEID